MSNIHYAVYRIKYMQYQNVTYNITFFIMSLYIFEEIPLFMFNIGPCIGAKNVLNKAFGGLFGAFIVFTLHYIMFDMERENTWKMTIE